MTKSLPSVTIGISFYNAEETLLDAIRSVFSQTHQDWELILVDDGSTDSSLKQARSIRDPRVIVHSDGCNKKLAARLNEINSLARHEFIARMDADDLMSHDRIEKQLRLLMKSPDHDLVSCGVVSMTDDLRPTGVRSASKNHKVTSKNIINGRSGIVHASILGRKAWFQRNPYDETLQVSQDTNLWIRAYAKNDLHIRIMRDPMYFYREDGNVNLRKLKQAYDVQRRTIVNNGCGYPIAYRIVAYAVASVKGLLLLGARHTGYLNLLRRRRNQDKISKALYEWIESEIEGIRMIELPKN